MKIAYAFRRSNFYPFTSDERALPPLPYRSEWLKRVQPIGFDGLELSVDSFGGDDATQPQVRELQQELMDAGLPCVVVRGGGGAHDFRVANANRRTLEKAVEIASWAGVETVNTTTGVSMKHPGMAGSTNGEETSQGSSRDAREDDFVQTAGMLHDVGELAGANGVRITVEVHQHGIADNSASVLHLIELADSEHVFVNPDLGNIFWTYNEPEETSEEAILALAPHSRYWHCKNLRRVQVPELKRSVFVRVPLPDGEIDYRFAISAMHAVGFDGYLAIEGATDGDQLTADRRSVDYVREILADIGAG